MLTRNSQLPPARRLHHDGAVQMLRIMAWIGLLPELGVLLALLVTGGNHLPGSLARAPFARDFSDFWAAGVLVDGRQTAILFDPVAFQHFLYGLFPYLHAVRLWSYPPGMALVVAPLGFLPKSIAWVLWFAGGTMALFGALRVIHGRALPAAVAGLVLISPVWWDNLLTGQNALITGSLIVLGYGLLDRRPAWAGIAFGLLTIKPQLGLLVPVAMLACGGFSAVLTAGLTAAAVAAASAVLLPGSWHLFFSQVAPAMNARLLHPYAQTDWQVLMGSPFIGAESIGLPQSAAFFVQAVITAASAVAIWLLWRRPVESDAARYRRMAASAGLGLAATPFCLNYDALGATALLVLAVTQGGLIGRSKGWVAALIAYAQPGWGLFLAVAIDAPIFTWAAWLALGLFCTWSGEEPRHAQQG